MSLISSGDIVLVTGATGFVGSAVLRKVAERGAKPRALARNGSNLANLAGVECEVAQGDMTDAGSMVRAMGGARFVFHVAADYRLWPPAIRARSCAQASDRRDEQR